MLKGEQTRFEITMKLVYGIEGITYAGKTAIKDE